MEKDIPIRTTEEKFYRQYLELMNPILKLRKRELDVLAELLYRYNALTDVSDEHKWKVLFSYDTRIDIRSKLGISEAGFNNILSRLRGRNVISDNRILKAFVVTPENNFILSFKFRMQ